MITMRTSQLWTHMVYNINPTCMSQCSTEHPHTLFKSLHAPNFFLMLCHLLGWTATKLAKACGHQSLADLLSLIEKRRTFVIERKVSSPHPHSSHSFPFLSSVPLLFHGMVFLTVCFPLFRLSFALSRHRMYKAVILHATHS